MDMCPKCHYCPTCGRSALDNAAEEPASSACSITAPFVNTVNSVPEDALRSSSAVWVDGNNRVWR